MRDETVLIQLLKMLYDRQNEDDESLNENTIIQFFAAPHDKLTLSSVLITKLTADPNNDIVWDSVGSTFQWGSGGMYDPSYGFSHSCADSLTLVSMVSVTNISVNQLYWGGPTVEPHWSWNMGGVWG